MTGGIQDVPYFQSVLDSGKHAADEENFELEVKKLKDESVPCICRGGFLCRRLIVLIPP